MKKLVLNKETVRKLESDELQNVAGGGIGADTVHTCKILCFQTQWCTYPRLCYDTQGCTGFCPETHGC